MDEQTTVYFHEVQRPRQLWIAVIVIGIAAFMWFTFIMQIIFGRTVGDNPMPDVLAVLLWLVFGIAFPVIWWIARLEVRVGEDAVTIDYVPFMRRKIAYYTIRAVRPMAYRPVAEFGGWGLRMWLRRTRVAYSVSGDQGVELVLRDERTVVIGSQRPERLADAITARLL